MTSRHQLLSARISHSRLGRKTCASHVRVTREIMKHVYASCTPTSTCTVLRSEKLCDLWSVRWKTWSADLLTDSFTSPGHRLSTVRLSSKHHDIHREVTRRSRLVASSTNRPLDPRRLAFSDFRLDRHSSLVHDRTILLKFAVAADFITVTAATTSDKHALTTCEPCNLSFAKERPGHAATNGVYASV